MRNSGLLCTLLVLLFGSNAAAQGNWSWTPLDRRVFVNVNGLVQSGEQTVDRSASISLYEETGDFKSRQTITNSGLLDIGGGFRVFRDYGVGISYTRFTTFGSAEISGSLPHPEIFDRPRAYSARATDLIHKEQALHLQAVWFVPYVKKVEVMVSGGPTFFTDVDQDFPIGITFSEAPPFDTVKIDEVREGRGSGSTVGFNIGGDVSYPVTRNVGVGATLRYTRGTMDYDVGRITSSIKAGNMQVGGGLRLRF